MSATPTADAPGGGFLTDHTHEGQPRKAITFNSGSIAYYGNYDILVEGITFQGAARIESENLILIPAEADLASDSRIELFGSNGTEASNRVFEQGHLVRPHDGRVLDDGKITRIFFAQGDIARYDKYFVTVSGQEVPHTVLAYRTIQIRGNVRSHEEIVVAGINPSGGKIILFKRPGLDGDAKPSRGYVGLHDDASTCIVFHEGDTTRFARGYKLVYEDGQSTTEHVRFYPNHLRYESVGRNILTEVKVYALDENGAEIELVFQGRFNGDVNALDTMAHHDAP